MSEETELFQYLKKIIPDLEMNKNQYGVIDCYSNQYELCAELKCRNKDYNELLIEKSKYDSLIQCKRSRYICSTPTGIYSFNLKSVPEPLWFEMWLPIHTKFEWSDQKILKKVGLLPIKLAKKI